jgi:phosphatidylglycerophosphate synthase
VATKDQRLGPSADAAVESANDDVIMGWRREVFGANLAVARRNHPERARLLHASSLCAGITIMTTLAPPTPNAPPAWWRLPDPPLRGRVLIAAGLGCLAAAGLALWVQSWLDTRPGQPLTSVAVFSTMIAVALVTMRDHHPFPYFGAANWVTMLRGVLVAVAASLITEPATSAVAWTVVVLTATITGLDGIDGWLARRARMSSTFGARFDMETDAFFMLVLSLTVWHHHKAGLWVISIGLMRYLFVAAGWAFPWLRRPLRSTWRGKTVAVGQLVALGVALLPAVPAPAGSRAVAAALAALVWSFAIDTRFLYNERARPDGRAL